MRNVSARNKKRKITILLIIIAGVIVTTALSMTDFFNFILSLMDNVIFDFLKALTGVVVIKYLITPCELD